MNHISKLLAALRSKLLKLFASPHKRSQMRGITDVEQDMCFDQKLQAIKLPSGYIPHVEQAMPPLCLKDVSSKVRKEFKSYKEAYKNGFRFNIKTHLKTLNDAINDMRIQELVVLAASAGAGKTAFAFDLGWG